MAVLETARDVNSPVIIPLSSGGAAFYAGQGLGNEGERAATEKNLKAAGYANWDGLMLRRANDNATTIEYKSAARAKIAGQGYTIIANAGDQASDLAGGYAERAYKLPNPMYFIP